MKVLGVIPARFKSSRFPGKPLVSICGKPMIIHVAEKADEAFGRNGFVVATDDIRIKETVEKNGYNSIITSEDTMTGTDRLWEVAQKMEADIYINIQGDEPIIDPNDILKIVGVKKNFPNFIVNAYTRILENEDPFSINIPKVIVNMEHELIYMSRMAIPGCKNEMAKPIYYKQVCIYAFSYEELKAFGTNQSKTYLESFEDIEILRFLEMGYKIKMVETFSDSLSVDVPSDVVAVERALAGKNHNPNG